MNQNIANMRNWANNRVRDYDRTLFVTVPIATTLARFHSESNPGTLYTVKSIGNLEGSQLYYTCDCPGYAFRKRCKHITEVTT